MKDTNYLFFNAKSKKYYYSGDPQICSICSKPVEDIIYFVISLLKREIIVKIYCWNCVNKRENLPAISEAVTNAIICMPDEIPPKSIAVPLVPLIPGGRSVKDQMTRPTSLTTLEAATDLSLEGEIIDHTKLAGRESWEGSQIGSDPVERIAELDSKIKDDSQAFKLLADLKAAEVTEPALPNQKEEVKEIELK